MVVNSVSFQLQPLLPQRDGLLSAMQQWISSENDPFLIRHKTELVRVVTQFLDTGSCNLVIEDLDIGELPDFLRHPLIRDQLRSLYVYRTQIEEIPEWIGEMNHLETLVLENNFHVDSLPETVANLASLRSLDIVVYGQEILSDFDYPDAMSQLHLDQLSIVGFEPLTFIPLLASQVHLKDLTILNCDLTEIPPEVFSCTALEKLNLANNMISLISPNIQQLTHLENLNLSSNNIRQVNDALFALRGDCEVHLEENRLNAAELTRLDGIIENEHYRGPRITTNDTGYLSEVSEEEVEESSDEEERFDLAINAFYAAFGQARPEFIDHLAEDEVTAKAFSDLLSQLQRRISTEHSFAPVVYASLSRSLELAAHNADYRQKCFHLIQGATETCGDGIIAIILRLSLVRQEMSLDIANPALVLEFILKAKLAMTLLEQRASHEVARQKIEIISSIRQAHPLMDQEQINQLARERCENEIDPVEVYLAYPIYLCKRLQLPLEIDHMFFRAVAGVSAEEFAAAAKDVEQRLQDRSYILSVLTQDDLWLHLLEQEYPQIFRDLAAEQERLADLPEEPSAADEMDPYVAFYEKKKKMLLQLSTCLYDRLQASLLDKDLEHKIKRSRED